MNFKFYLTNMRTGETISIPEPVGMDSFRPTFRRDKNSHGMYFEFSDNELSFEGRGREMIVSESELYGINAKIELLIEYRCGKDWKEFYRSMLDFTTLNMESGNTCFARIKVGQQGVQMTFRNRIDTKVDLESVEAFDGGAMATYENLGKEIEIPGKAIRMVNFAERKNQITIGRGGWTCSVPFGDPVISEIPDFMTGQLFMEGIYIDNPENHFGGNAKEFAIFTNLASNINSGKFHLGLHLEVNQKGTLSGITQTGWMGVIVIDGSKKTHNNQVWTRFFGEDTSGSIIADFTESITINQEVDIPKGGSLCACITCFDDSPTFLTTVKQASVKMTTNSIFDPTFSKTFMIHESLSRITESITDGQLTVKSDYYGRTDSEINPVLLDGTGGLRCLTNGFNIRRAVFENGEIPKFYASFNDLYDGLMAIDAIGFGIETDVNGSYIRIEPLNYFYNDDVILSCKNINSVKISFDNSRLFGVANIGYNNWEAEEWNGIDGFHTKRQYRTRLDTDTEFDQFSELIADSYAIESTRRRQVTEQSIDWQFDDDVFIFDLRRDNGLKVNTGYGDPNTLIDPDSVMNVELSPARNAARWFSWIMQGATDTIGRELIFTSAEGYAGAITKTIGKQAIVDGSVAENQNITGDDIVVESLQKPKFKPKIAEFEYPMTFRDFAYIKDNPHGLVEFNGEYGWIDAIEADLLNGLARFTLILKA